MFPSITTNFILLDRVTLAIGELSFTVVAGVLETFSSFLDSCLGEILCLGSYSSSSRDSINQSQGNLEFSQGIHD
jgi:hypothetical protein